MAGLTKDVKSMSKLDRLEEILKDAGKGGGLVLAFSGGLDSTFLAYFLKKLGKDFIAVTVDTGLLPDPDMITDTAKDLGIDHKVVKRDLFKDRDFIENSHERCYFCKKEIIQVLRDFDREIIDASNYSDLKDYRAGIIALTEEGVLTPLVEALITKEDVIKFSKEFGLPIKAQDSCLATRIPVDTWIEEGVVDRIRNVEKAIKHFGIALVRARVHGNMLRIQVMESEMEHLLKNRDAVVRVAKKEGFDYIGLDLDSYRT